MKRKLIALFILIIMLVVSSCSSNDGIAPTRDMASLDLSEDSSAGGGDESEETIAEYTASSAQENLDAGEEEKDDTSEQSAPPSLDTVTPHAQALFDILQDIINKQENAYEIFDTAYDDFDGNGAYEMFARVATTEGADFYLVSDSGAMLIKQMPAGWEWSLGPVIDVGQQKFIAHRTDGVSGWTEYLYGVRDGVAYETNLYGRRGMLMRGNEYGELLVADSQFDASIGGTGHTWKPYWFYFDGQVFREYGGIPITLEQIRALDKAIGIPEGYQDKDMTSAFYRGNGIININYTAGDHNKHLTYRYKDGRLIFEGEDENYGVYLAALHEDLAVFPDGLPVT